MRNDAVRLNGTFESAKNPSSPALQNIGEKEHINLAHLQELADELKQLKQFWMKNTLKITPIVSVHYTRIIPKSKRLSALFAAGSFSPNNSIIGAKYLNEAGNTHHVITHAIPLSMFDETIEKLQDAQEHARELFGDKVSLSHNDIQSVIDDKDFTKRQGYGKTAFVNVLLDSFHVSRFNLEEPKEHFTEAAIVTLYDTGVTPDVLFRRLGIKLSPDTTLADNTLLLTPAQLSVLMEKAPYLVCMAVSDISSIPPITDKKQETIKRTIPEPTNQPTIGVIDTLFSKNVYFSGWVDPRPCLDPSIIQAAGEEDRRHGTAVSSLIVDGPTLNPDLDDGCGRFKVRHFEVATNSRNSSFTIMRSIQTILAGNKDIRVWNLSLGSERESNPNFISPESAVLDTLQKEFNVIFVVAGTNKTDTADEEQVLGAPADSLNAVTVNSVSKKNIVCDYSRRGPVLTFFQKPDVSYYGDGIRVETGNGERIVSGTSFAAPWIARKLSYLIDVLGQPREVAKAMLIDAASGWNAPDKPEYRGYGTVPLKIGDIISSASDEIRFILYGSIEKYETFSTRIPVPISQGKYPYLVRATLCYFPKCSRTEGVDYTDTELDLSFGRIGKNSRITPIVNDWKRERLPAFASEVESRKAVQKWENTKHIGEFIKTRQKAKQMYGMETWGISLRKMERLAQDEGKGMCFGIVVTLKEMNGVNRYDEFIKRCNLNNWITQKIQVELMLDVYAKADEVVHLE
jgi:hypothetical protein